MFSQLRDRLLGRRHPEPVPPAPAEPDRSDGEEVVATEEELLREATAPGEPRINTDNL